MSHLRFFVSPQPPKPSMLSLVTGSWRPNSEDTARGLEAGLGATTMAINGAIGGQSSWCRAAGDDGDDDYDDDVLFNDMSERAIRVCALFLNSLTKNPTQKECLFRVVEDYRHSHPGRTKKAAFGNK